MSSLSEMKSGERSPSAAFERRHALYRLLALLAAGLLMVWVSGGLMAQPVQFFLQACAHFSQLLAARGVAFLSSFALLLVQSLLLVAAWVFYLLIALRELRYGSAARAATAIDAAETVILEAPAPKEALVSHGGAFTVPSPEPAREKLVHSQRTVKTSVAPNPFEDDIAAMETMVSPLSSSIGEPATKQALFPAASHEAKGTGVQPAPVVNIQQERHPAQEGQERSSSTLKKTKLRRSQVVASAGEAPAALSTRPAEKTEEQPSTQLIPYVSQASGEMDALNPFYEPEAGAEAEHFSSILREMGFFQLEQQESERREARGAGQDARLQGERKEENKRMARRAEVPETKGAAPDANPFGVHADILELFAPAKPAEEEEMAPPQIAPSPTELPPDQLYVYGNPFEGPLPDIFQHDESLKNTVLDQVAEELEERQTGGQLKSVEKHTPGGQGRTAKRPPPRRKNQ